MAIQLSANTQQQQKAPFAAFDSTSRYRSGLSGVAEGLSKVGQLAEQGRNFFTKKDEQAQELLAQVTQIGINYYPRTQVVNSKTSLLAH